MGKVLTVATRDGKLAIAQTEVVIRALREIYPDTKIELKKVTTSGDKDRRTALWDLKDSGFFTTQVEDALMAGEADFAVHSFKDLPTAQREGLSIAAVCDRKFAEDCLIFSSRTGSIEQLPAKAKIGTSSLRRAVQLKRLRADLVAEPIRGNVTTRVRKLNEDRYDAIILARAGLERLGLSDRISLCFDPRQFIPAPAQGALAVQTRTDDNETNELIASIDEQVTRTITSAERKILTTMQCGCHAPVGAFAEIAEGEIKICAFISDLEARNFIRREIVGPVANADDLAERLASELLEAGGSEILERLEN